MICMYAKFQVYAWGDNDHGQQGTGNTIVNKVPTRVLGTEGHIIRHVACGSSHSVAWAEVNSSASIIQEPLAFSANRDPLGASAIRPIFNYDEASKNMRKFVKEHRPSLSKTVLQLKSIALQQESLQNLLTVFQIQISREAIVAYMHQTKDELSNLSFLNLVSERDNARLCSDKCQDDPLFFEDQVLGLGKLLKLALYGHLNRNYIDIIADYLKSLSDNSELVS